MLFDEVLKGVPETYKFTVRRGLDSTPMSKKRFLDRSHLCNDENEWWPMNVDANFGKTTLPASEKTSVPEIVRLVFLINCYMIIETTTIFIEQIAHVFRNASLGHRFVLKYSRLMRHIDPITTVSSYFSMSQRCSMTYWHAGFTGTSVFFTVIVGCKELWLLQPTPNNRNLLDRFHSSDFCRE